MFLIFLFLLKCNYNIDLSSYFKVIFFSKTIIINIYLCWMLTVKQLAFVIYNQNVSTACALTMRCLINSAWYQADNSYRITLPIVIAKDRMIQSWIICHENALNLFDNTMSTITGVNGNMNTVTKQANNPIMIFFQTGYCSSKSSRLWHYSWIIDICPSNSKQIIRISSSKIKLKSFEILSKTFILSFTFYNLCCISSTLSCCIFKPHRIISFILLSLFCSNSLIPIPNSRRYSY